MARAAPVPLYATLVQTPAPLAASKRLMSSTSPGTTNDLATVCPNQLAATTLILIPEGTATPVATPPATPVLVTSGWIIANISGYAPATSALSIDAGTWTFNVAYLRAGGLATNDNGCVINAVLVKVNTTYSTNLSEICRTSSASVTITTTLQTATITGSGVAVTLQAGEALMLVVYVLMNFQVVTDSYQFPTNSTAGLRCTAAPTYSIQYVNNHAESVPLSDAQTRKLAYVRAQLETVPTPTDMQSRIYNGVRIQAETVPTPIDNQKRLYQATRNQTETNSVTDLQTRFTVYRRAQNESGLTPTDVQSRRVAYVRPQNEVLSSGGGGTTNYYRPVFIFDD
jgi:hypothetical protein